MSWRDTLADAEARLVVLEAAELKILGGEQVSKIAYDGESLEYSKGATLAEITRAIQETRMMIQRLGSGSRTGGAIIPNFGF